jgi:hypothetical protein
MSSFERICPQCGTGNPLQRTQCVKCRAPLTVTTVPPPPPPTDYLSRRGMARLAWRATKFFARTGFNLAVRSAKRNMHRAPNRNKQNVKSEMIDGDYIVPTDRSSVPPDTSSNTRPSSSNRGDDAPPPPTRLNDWRVYTKPAAPDDRPNRERIRWGKKN